MTRKNLTAESGERTNYAGHPVHNRILLRISDGEFRLVRPHLEYLRLPSHLTLHEPSERLKFIYFPNAGLISLTVPMRNGQTVEAGVVGREGAAGIAITVGLTKSLVREIVQVAADGFKVDADVMPRPTNTGGNSHINRMRASTQVVFEVETPIR